MSAPKFYRKDQVADKIVIDTTGKKLGKAKEIAFSLDGAAALFVGKDDGNELEVPMTRVMGVSDFIVVRVEEAVAVMRPGANVQAPISPPPVQPAAVQAAPTVMACRSCGAPLKPGARFCTKCGTSTV